MSQFISPCEKLVKKCANKALVLCVKQVLIWITIIKIQEEKHSTFDLRISEKANTVLGNAD